MKSSRLHTKRSVCLTEVLTRREMFASVIIGAIGVSVATAQDQTAVKPASTRTVSLKPQVWQETHATSRRLLDQSRDSFERGLMPLADHLDQLSLATNLNLRLASATNQPDVQRDWQTRLVRQLEGVAAQLERFQQPASAGWQADVFLARFGLTNAQARLATMSGQREVAAAAQNRAAEFARKHWATRLDDSSIGHASAMQIWRAASLLNKAEQQPVGTGREVLKQAIQATDRWNLLDAGIGRGDLREALQYELARVDLLESKPGTTAFDANAQQAESLLVKLHATSMQFQSKGTASLYDVASTWRERSELHSFLQSAGDNIVPKTWQQRRESDLRSLQRLSANTADRRGRNAADATYVEVLSLAEQTSDVR